VLGDICREIPAGKRLRVSYGIDTFENQVLPKHVKVDNGGEFIGKILDKWAYENNV